MENYLLEGAAAFFAARDHPTRSLAPAGDLDTDATRRRFEPGERGELHTDSLAGPRPIGGG